MLLAGGAAGNRWYWFLLELLAVPAVRALCLDGMANCCHISSKDPQYADFKISEDHQVPGWSTVDLDLPPAERWAHVVAPKAKEIKSMLETFKGFLGFVSRDLAKLLERSKYLEKQAPSIIAAMPFGYGEEIAGIANATGIDLLDLLVYNMMYEVEGGCTSIVAQDGSGRLVHGRNLDFGLFFGEDWRHLQWSLTEKLRPVLQRVRFVKGGHVIFNSTVFLGYVGLLTGAKKGGFSVTVNTRYDFDMERGVRDFITGKDRSGQFLSFLLREVMMYNQTYDEALASIRSTELVGAAYVILGGSRPGEGAVVARNRTSVVQERLLSDAAAKGDPFVVQTNWDYPHDPLIDNRRAPAEHCLREEDPRREMSFEAMFRVLSAHPNRNRLTTYTSLMSAQSGDFESYLQFCTEMECAPWKAAEAAELIV